MRGTSCTTAYFMNLYISYSMTVTELDTYLTQSKQNLCMYVCMFKTETCFSLKDHGAMHPDPMLSLFS